MAGWWYVHNLRTTGTLSGLSESVMLRRMGAGEMARKAAEIHWPKAIDAILFSHLYFGGWSSLTVRSWIYHIFYLMVLLTVFGLTRMRKPVMLTLLAIYLSFWIGQLYNVVLLYASKGLAASMGWYLYAAVAAEVTLCLIGLRGLAPEKFGRWPAAIGAIMFAVLDFFTMHAVAIPYYAGMIRHRANGSLAAVHGGEFQTVGFAGVAARLTIFKSPYAPVGLLLALWFLYVLGTTGAVYCALRPKQEGNLP